jgi:hypothetical protein
MHNRGMTSLKQRFQRFMLSTPGVESIDDLVRLRESELTGRKRADFLACDRRVVIETKSLDIVFRPGVSLRVTLMPPVAG